jgi:nitric oxide reductase NorQ protein
MKNQIDRELSGNATTFNDIKNLIEKIPVYKILYSTISGTKVQYHKYYDLYTNERFALSLTYGIIKKTKANLAIIHRDNTITTIYNSSDELINQLREYCKNNTIYDNSPKENNDTNTLQLENNSEKDDLQNTLQTNIPPDLIISTLNWKYLIRNIIRGENILITGESGSGKTKAIYSAASSLKRPFFVFNLGATQDPKTTLIGMMGYKKESGTYFNESEFIKAIKTPNAIILLDELSRAHPEAWNILISVLDEKQRYLRIDETGEQIKVAPGVSFLATANIGCQYTGTRILDKALIDRFTIIEMPHLNKEDESKLIKYTYPKLKNTIINDLTEFTDILRNEAKNGMGKIQHSLSTRSALKMAAIINDGFSFIDAVQLIAYPQYSEEGGLESERTYIKQVLQKFNGEDQEYIFNKTENSSNDTNIHKI